MFNMTSSSHLPVLQAGTPMFTPFCLESFSRAFRRAKRRFAGNHIHVIDGRVEPVCIGCFPIFRALQVHKLPDHLGSMHLEKKQKTASMDLHGSPWHTKCRKKIVGSSMETPCVGLIQFSSMPGGFHLYGLDFVFAPHLPIDSILRKSAAPGSKSDLSCTMIAQLSYHELHHVRPQHDPHEISINIIHRSSIDHLQGAFRISPSRICVHHATHLGRTVSPLLLPGCCPMGSGPAQRVGETW